jgi:hypothetical protein
MTVRPIPLVAYDYPILGLLWSLAILLVCLLVITAIVIWSWPEAWTLSRRQAPSTLP